MTLQTNGQTGLGVWGYHNIPAFSSKSARIIKMRNDNTLPLSCCRQIFVKMMKFAL